MVRTQIYLTEKEQSLLRKLAARSGKKRSELIRQAVDQFLATHDAGHRREVLQRSAGMWKERRDLPDFEHLRRSWDRQ